MRDGVVVAELPGGATEQQVLLAGAAVDSPTPQG
jgi:hypothetical protein